MGDLGNLPPGEGGLNPYGGYFFMWHSHTEKELTNYDIFPGGMLSMMVVEPPGTPINLGEGGDTNEPHDCKQICEATGPRAGRPRPRGHALLRADDVSICARRRGP